MLKKSLMIGIITICCGFLVGCSTLYDKGKFENKLLRLETQDNHASLERVEGVGTALETVSESGFPKFWIGKFAHTQIFLPKMLCTTFYLPDGVTKEKMLCETIAPLSVEAQINAKGGRVGDVIQTGDATLLGSDYDSWAEMIKQQVLNSSLDDATKEDYIKILDATKEKEGVK